MKATPADVWEARAKCLERLAEQFPDDAEKYLYTAAYVRGWVALDKTREETT